MEFLLKAEENNRALSCVRGKEKKERKKRGEKNCLIKLYTENIKQWWKVPDKYSYSSTALVQYVGHFI